MALAMSFPMLETAGGGLEANALSNALSHKLDKETARSDSYERFGQQLAAICRASSSCQ